VGLVLGRTDTNHLFTLAQLTSMGSVRVEDNWYTTLPVDRLDDSGVGGLDVRYRTVYKTPSRSGASCDAYAVSYSPGTNFFIGGNTVSLAAFDFWPDYADAKVTYPTFDSTTAPSVQMQNPGIAWVQGSFPFGRTARVLPQTSPVSRTYSWRIGGSPTPTPVPFTDDQLDGAWEVVLGDPVMGAATVTDEFLEREIVWLTVLSGSNYAPGVSAGTGSIFIYDGPEWSLIEITHAEDPFSGETTAVGVSNDATASGGNANPAVAANMLVSRSTPMPL